ncbi:putative phage abortive infection protein [Desulfovibrio sp.]|uniref:putative phage abortive infection protein n=1 Tax=Desulfovibrio sp. TaxID=885 RepID=UPI0035B4AA01
MKTVTFFHDKYDACASKFRCWMGNKNRCFIVQEINSLFFDYIFPISSGTKKVLKICFFTIVVWMLGVLLLDAPAPLFWAKFFAKTDQLENIFAPVAAFFSGLSASATAYLIYLQMKTIEKADIESKKMAFERQLFLMFELRNKIISSLRYENADLSSKVEDMKIFSFFFGVLHGTFYKFFGKMKIVTSYSQGKNEDVNKIVEIVSKRDELSALHEIEWDGDRSQSFVRAFKAIAEIISDENSHLLSPYYHNIYVSLKLIFENDSIDIEEKYCYMRLFRAQFSQQELMLIYIHALVHSDRHDNKYKFKELIENTCFFHSLLDEFKFIKLNNRNLVYKECAFKHPETAAD